MRKIAWLIILIFTVSFVQMAEGQTFEDCPQLPMLLARQTARVLPNATPALNVRAEPNSDSQLVGELPVNTLIQVLAGPICTSEYIYWQIGFEGGNGWVAEANTQNYLVGRDAQPFNLSGVQFILPPTIATTATSEFIAGIPLGDSNYGFWEQLPSHISISLFDGLGEFVGNIRVYRTNDYETYYPTSMLDLEELGMAKRGATEMFYNHDWFVVNAGTEFVARGEQLEGVGGRMARFLTRHTQAVKPFTSEFEYRAFALQGEYFIQVYYRIFTPLYPRSNSVAERLQGFPNRETGSEDEWANFVEGYDDLLREVDNTLSEARPTDFAPYLGRVDDWVRSILVQPNIISASGEFEPFVNCDGFKSRLQIGDVARVTPGTPNNLRSLPSLSDGEKIGEIPGGDTFTVLEISCSYADGVIWLHVDYNGVDGWTGEGKAGVYWVEPLP